MDKTKMLLCKSFMPCKLLNFFQALAHVYKKESVCPSLPNLSVFQATDCTILFQCG